MNKRLLLLLIPLFVLSASREVAAQPGEQMQRFKEEKIEFFNKKLDLTEKQQKIFWPLYDDHFNRQLKIMEDERNLLHYYSQNAAHMSDEEVGETLDKYFKIKEQYSALEEEFHPRFLEVLGERKTMTLYTLEREFRMHVLRKFRGGRGGDGRRGRGRHP